MFGSIIVHRELTAAWRELNKPTPFWKIDRHQGGRGGHNKYHMPKARRRMRNKMALRSRRINRMRAK